jgi:hypothetical protein
MVSFMNARAYLIEMLIREKKEPFNHLYIQDHFTFD